jgi:L-threonylcarbamoyladenylate synthase
MIFSDIQRACDLLIQGKVVAIPTETVYGLAAHGYNAQAIDQIYVLKSSSCRVPLIASAGLPSLALRVPSHPIVRQVLERCPMPLAAPSANVSGYLSPTQAKHVQANFSIPTLEGGACHYGLESTIVDCRNTPRILRTGALCQQEIERLLGQPIEKGQEKGTPSAPGQLSEHYAPSKRVRLDAMHVAPYEGLVAFGPPLSGALVTVQLSLTQDVEQAASVLFDALYHLDQSPWTSIAVMPIPDKGIGMAIQDRLYRASLSRRGQ